jgi:hypothetical protein
MDNGLRFLPSNVLLLGSYLFPRIRGEDKPNNPNDYIHSLPNDSSFSEFKRNSRDISHTQTAKSDA